MASASAGQAGVVPGAHPPSSCENLWTATSNSSQIRGAWETGADWSLQHAPLSSENACIWETVKSDYYTVTVNSNAVANSVQTGGGSGKAIDVGSASDPCGSDSLTAHGGITLADGTDLQLNLPCSGDTMVDVGTSTLLFTGSQKGRLGLILGGNPGTLVIHGNVESHGFIEEGTGAETSLKVEGSFTEGADTTTLMSPQSSDNLIITGAAVLGGSLRLGAAPSNLEPGDTFPFLTAASITGSFSSEQSPLFASQSGWLDPVRSGGQITLVAVVAHTSATPSQGPPGSTFTLTGSNYAPGDTVRLTFTDKASRTTYALPSATADSSGGFTDTVTVPAGAVPGKAVITARSTIVMHMLSRATFAVTA